MTHIKEEHAKEIALNAQDHIFQMGLDNKKKLKSEMKRLLSQDNITDNQLLWFTVGWNVGMADTLEKFAIAAREEQKKAEKENAKTDSNSKQSQSK